MSAGDGDRPDADDVMRAQAAVFIEQLELIATQLEQQVTALEGSAREPGCRAPQRLLNDARARRLELYEARHHIDTLRQRTGV